MSTVALGACLCAAIFRVSDRHADRVGSNQQAPTSDSQAIHVSWALGDAPFLGDPAW